MAIVIYRSFAISGSAIHSIWFSNNIARTSLYVYSRFSSFAILSQNLCKCMYLIPLYLYHHLYCILYYISRDNYFFQVIFLTRVIVMRFIRTYISFLQQLSIVSLYFSPETIVVVQKKVVSAYFTF